MQFKIKFFAMFLLVNINVFGNIAESKEKQTFKITNDQNNEKLRIKKI